MRKDLVLWNKEMNADNRIAEDLRYFSNGELEADEEILKAELPKQQGERQNRPQGYSQRRKNRKRY